MCTMFPTASPEALDLMEKLLQFNPDKRIRQAYMWECHVLHSERLYLGIVVLVSRMG